MDITDLWQVRATNNQFLGLFNNRNTKESTFKVGLTYGEALSWRDYYNRKGYTYVVVCRDHLSASKNPA